MFTLNGNTTIKSEYLSKPIANAINILKRDMKKVFGDEKGIANTILLQKSSEIQKECYKLIVETKDELILQAADELGFVYALLYISEKYLGVKPFWFWLDNEPEKKQSVNIEKQIFVSQPYAIKYRGWFVNDEVLLDTWYVNRHKDEPWEMVFEALLRLGGNMTIPGTDKNSRKYNRMASDMGLYITHHHAEPLGAPMFARVYPNLQASYDKNPEKFEELWRMGLEEQKDMKVIWNIGFRGQGDRPFWDDDPQYSTPESRGKLMSSLIRKQYNMVKQQNINAVCCTNLYGETMELYKGGYLDLPEDVIKIWADNGFGKMVSRRQGNHNPRVVALPNEGDKGNHGIYYHASFYDLQAANHMTMLPNSPEFVKKELENVISRGIKDYWIINCSNIKPHVYTLDYIAAMWRDGKVDIDEHRTNYIEKYYGADNAKKVSEAINDYYRYAVKYGENEDDYAGEQFANHVPRILISQYMRDKSNLAEELRWATNADSLEKQVGWYTSICKQAVNEYKKYLDECEVIAASMKGASQELFKDTILLQAQIHYYCYLGAYNVCQSLINAFSKDFKVAFYKAGVARKNYLIADNAMRSREHGKWKNYYENECLADIKQSAWVLEGLMSFLRNLGDGPHFYEWQREFLYSVEDRRVMLILNMENHLNNLALFELMEEKLGDNPA